MTKAKKSENPFFGMDFGDALQRLIQTDKGELADAMAKNLVEGMRQTHQRIEDTREEIARGARTRDKKDRFRL